MFEYYRQTVKKGSRPIALQKVCLLSKEVVLLCRRSSSYPILQLCFPNQTQQLLGHAIFLSSDMFTSIGAKECLITF